MMRKCSIIRYLLLIFGLFFAGCSGLSAVLYDANDYPVTVSSLKFDKGDVFKVLDKDVYREIPAEEVGKILIDSKETRSYKGKLYYQTEIYLVNGNIIQSYELEDGRKIGAFVCVENSLSAKTLSGPVRIDLRKINKIEFTKD